MGYRLVASTCNDGDCPSILIDDETGGDVIVRGPDDGDPDNRAGHPVLCRDLADPARPAVTTLDAPEFQALFDAARVSVFRLETRQSYAVAAEDEHLIAFRTGAPRPERSVRTSPWLRRIAVSTANGVSWSRVRVIEHPLTEYTRFELVAFVESQAAGEQVRLTEKAAPVEDFWLIDGRTDRPIGVWMRYDDHGNLLVREQVTDRSVLASLADVQDSAWEAATPLNVWLATA